MYGAEFFAMHEPFFCFAIPLKIFLAPFVPLNFESGSEQRITRAEILKLHIGCDRKK
jgi:hypothetical protein